LTHAERFEAEIHAVPIETRYDATLNRDMDMVFGMNRNPNRQLNWKVQSV